MTENNNFEDDDILQRAMDHYNKLSDDLRSISIPEWGSDEQPLIIYWKPSTLDQERKIVKMSKGDPFDKAARMVVTLSLKADGSKMFTKPNAVHEMLKRCDSRVVTRIAAEMFKDSLDDNTEDEEEEQGN